MAQLLYTGTHVIADPLAIMHQQQQQHHQLQYINGSYGPVQPQQSHVSPESPSIGNSSSTRPPSVSTDTPSIAMQMLTIRMLMSGKEVGSIIGRKGENVKKYREESGARINISDGSCPERIVTVTGTVDQIHIAFSMMCQKFEGDFTQSMQRAAAANAATHNTPPPAQAPKSSQSGSSPLQADQSAMNAEDVSCPPVTLRLLVPATQCGSVIGKGGCKIKEIRELTGASIQVASEVLPNSSERTVTISGTAKAIAKCIKQLCLILLESPAKGATIPYRPKPVMLASQPQLPPHQQHPHYSLANGLHHPVASQLLAAAGPPAPPPMPFGTAPDLNKPATPVNVSMGLPFQAGIPGDAILASACLPTAQLALAAAAAAAAATSGNPALPSHQPPLPPPIIAQPHPQLHYPQPQPHQPHHTNRPAPPAPTNTHELVIPNDLIGCIIGRGGSKINEIRQLSGAQIKINNCDEGAKERRVTVTGTPETIATAQYLISSRRAAGNGKSFGDTRPAASEEAILPISLTPENTRAQKLFSGTSSHSIELHRQLLALNMAVCAGFSVGSPPVPMSTASSAANLMFRSQPLLSQQHQLVAPQGYIDVPYFGQPFITASAANAPYAMPHQQLSLPAPPLPLPPRQQQQQQQQFCPEPMQQFLLQQQQQQQALQSQNPQDFQSSLTTKVKPGLATQRRMQKFSPY